MKIQLSTATVRAYKNRRKSMNLHYRPIVMLEGLGPFHVDYFKEVRWEILAEPIGSRAFDISVFVDSPFAVRSGVTYVEYHLSAMQVPFQHDDFECKLTYNAVLDLPHSSPIEIVHSCWGVVKAIW